jgi:regulator of PEP synthase PpsR (kinase-PPPase family)
VTASPADPIRVLVLSDATGALVRHMLTALMRLFPSTRFDFHFEPYVETSREAEEAIERHAGTARGVVHAVTAPETKRAIEERCAAARLSAVDVTGGAITFLEEVSGSAADSDVRRLPHLDERYFQRMEALEFTLQHDDSRRLESIGAADIVLVGVSRVSKTPTATFLGSLGYKVANVSIAAEVGLPLELDSVAGRVVGLTARPHRIREIRSRRTKRFQQAIEKAGLQHLTYYDLASVTDEVRRAEAEYRRRGYPIVDVSDLTVEEIAAKILEFLGLSFVPSANVPSKKS